jgi:hypothetical protein
MDGGIIAAGLRNQTPKRRSILHEAPSAKTESNPEHDEPS